MGHRRPRGAQAELLLPRYLTTVSTRTRPPGTNRPTPDDYHLSATKTAAPTRSRWAVDQRELVERAQRGDHDAFAALAGVFVARLDAAARLILRDHDLARDAVQDGFIRAWRSLPSLRDPDRFEAWLRSLVARSCIDILRRRGRRPIEVELIAARRAAIADLRPRSPTASCST